MSLLDEPLAGVGNAPLRIVRPGQPVPPGAITVLVDEDGMMPLVDPADYDIMLTVATGAPTPWVALSAAQLSRQLKHVSLRVETAPRAATLLQRVLRIGAELSFAAALEIESWAYSTLLGGQEFQTWRASRKARRAAETSLFPVRYEREGNRVTLTLASPQSRNAMSATMRDALFEALVNVAEDPSAPDLVLCGEGRCFSTGGDLAEFGVATDLAEAHAIRTSRSCATLIFALGERVTARLQGACIGAGIELPAAAARRVATRDCFVQLPELAMGLIPGAGGTVTLPRAIGRHRTAWLALSGLRLNAGRARSWGLFHDIVP